MTKTTQEIERNHGRTLRQLHEAGGLTTQEPWRAAHGHGPRYAVDRRDADEWLARIATPQGST